MSLLADWKKIPAVTEGGKEFFYYNKEKALTVVWHRRLKKWVISDRAIDDQIGQFDTPNAAIKAANGMKPWLQRFSPSCGGRQPGSPTYE